MSMRFQYRAAGPIAAASLLALLTACSRTQQDWRVAQQAGTPQAYQVFVARHPDSELAGVARQRIAQLSEQAAWQQATRANTAAAYQDYLAKYPNGSWSQDARIRMESRTLAAGGSPLAGQSAVSGGPTASTGAAPVADPHGPGAGASPAAPQSVPAASAAQTSPRMPAAAQGVAVQLGAFSSVTNADTEWRQLSSRFQSQLRGLTAAVVPVMSSGRRLYRLEARVASQAAARRLCRQLQQQSQGCLPLP